MSGDRKLDIEVARTVFGVKRVYCRYGKPWDEATAEHSTDRPFFIPSGKPWRTHSIDAMPVPRYSSDIGAAMLLVDRWHGDVDMRRQNGFWLVTFFEPSREYRAIEETLPEAICRAALAAVGRADAARDEETAG